jgi:hypothetical protein
MTKKKTKKANILEKLDSLKSDMVRGGSKYDTWDFNDALADMRKRVDSIKRLIKK